MGHNRAGEKRKRKRKRARREAERLYRRDVVRAWIGFEQAMQMVIDRMRTWIEQAVLSPTFKEWLDEAAKTPGLLPDGMSADGATWSWPSGQPSAVRGPSPLRAALPVFHRMQELTKAVRDRGG
jgi:hypothetical protein